MILAKLDQTALDQKQFLHGPNGNLGRIPKTPPGTPTRNRLWQSFRDETSGKVHPYRPEHINGLHMHVPHFLNTPQGVATERDDPDGALLGTVHGCHEGRYAQVYNKKLVGVIPIGFVCMTNTSAVLKRLALDKDDQQTPEGMRSFKGKCSLMISGSAFLIRSFSRPPLRPCPNL